MLCAYSTFIDSGIFAKVMTQNQTKNTINLQIQEPKNNSPPQNCSNSYFLFFNGASGKRYQSKYVILQSTASQPTIQNKNLTNILAIKLRTDKNLTGFQIPITYNNNIVELNTTGINLSENNRTILLINGVENKIVRIGYKGKLGAKTGGFNDTGYCENGGCAIKKCFKCI